MKRSRVTLKVRCPMDFSCSRPDHGRRALRLLRRSPFDPRYLPWFSRFLARLLENQPTVTALLEKNPFPDKLPVYVRAQFYDYTYASSEEKAGGRWWNRRLVGLYFPEARLKGE